MSTPMSASWMKASRWPSNTVSPGANGRAFSDRDADDGALHRRGERDGAFGGGDVLDRRRGGQEGFFRNGTAALPAVDENGERVGGVDLGAGAARLRAGGGGVEEQATMDGGVGGEQVGDAFLDKPGVGVAG